MPMYFDVQFTELSQAFDVQCLEPTQSFDTEFDTQFTELPQMFDAQCLESTQSFDIEFDTVVGLLPDQYTGEYNIIPSQHKQVFRTQNKSMSENFVVHPIPKNYGLITYNGYEITVS